MATETKQKVDPKSNVATLVAQKSEVELLMETKNDAELEALFLAMQKVILEKRNSKKSFAISEIERIATEAGLSNSELKAIVKNFGSTRNPDDIKTYFNPANAEEKWVDNGGRKPKFIREWLKAGKSLEELVVQTQAPAPEAEQAPADANANEQLATA